VETDSPEDGLLVLTDTYYPGWRAFVDGREEHIVSADYLFRGVPLAAGKHSVEFVYAPDSFRIGLLLSGVTAVAIGWVAGMWIWRKRSIMTRATRK